MAEGGRADGATRSERRHLANVAQTFERWDGKGDPNGVGGQDLLMPARLVNLADVVEVFHHAGGLDAAIAVARQRSGTQFDPQLVEIFCDAAEEIFTELESVTSWDALMAAEPAVDPEMTDDEFDRALEDNVGKPIARSSVR